VDAAVLEGRRLTRTYRLGSTRVEALAGVDVEVRRGEILALQGPSGSGKTTLINLLGLLDGADGGEVLLDGRSVPRRDENLLADLRRDRFGFVFQTFNLVPVLTAAENVEVPMALQGASRARRRRRARELLERVGIAGKAEIRPDLLSGGQRQRVAIARALANDPEIILADEPTANLDSATAGEILDLLGHLAKERRVALVLATHDPAVVERAGRVVTLRDGRVAARRD
jgi:putative ABC transport system ATP-binding protein